MGRIKGIIATAAAALALVGVATAHQGATGVVKTRMDAMEEIADQMKHIAGMLRGQREFDASAAASAAETISEHAASFPDYFPEGSDGAPSEARAVIWEDWDAFSKIAARLEKRAEHLDQAAEAASRPFDLQAGFSAVGETCKSCHERFRLED